MRPSWWRDGCPGGERIHLQWGRSEFNPWFGKIPWRRAWQSTPVFLLGESHEQRSLVGYSPKESDTTEQLSMHIRTDDYRLSAEAVSVESDFSIALGFCTTYRCRVAIHRVP